uniref:Nucleic acid binding protein n=1 Tax=Rhizophora mucronata TaxID=61149 RepID=A0A2P2LPP0_RHIMU
MNRDIAHKLAKALQNCLTPGILFFFFLQDRSNKRITKHKPSYGTSLIVCWDGYPCNLSTSFKMLMKGTSNLILPEKFIKPPYKYLLGLTPLPFSK